jgi:hypothetical protein
MTPPPWGKGKGKKRHQYASQGADHAKAADGARSEVGFKFPDEIAKTGDKATSAKA